MRTLPISIAIGIIGTFAIYNLIALLASLTFWISYLDIVRCPGYIIFFGLCSIVASCFIADSYYSSNTNTIKK
jgi:hypothetical protein